MSLNFYWVTKIARKSLCVGKSALTRKERKGKMHNSFPERIEGIPRKNER